MSTQRQGAYSKQEAGAGRARAPGNKCEQREKKDRIKKTYGSGPERRCRAAKFDLGEV